jgi:hypothetical protein
MTLKLQRSLAMELLEHLCVDPRWRGRRVCVREGAHRGGAGGCELLDLSAPASRDAREVVDLLPPGFALGEKVTKFTVGAGDRFGRWFISDEALKALAYMAGVRVEILWSERLPLA